MPFQLKYFYSKHLVLQPSTISIHHPSKVPSSGGVVNWLGASLIWSMVFWAKDNKSISSPYFRAKFLRGLDWLTCQLSREIWWVNQQIRAWRLQEKLEVDWWCKMLETTPYWRLPASYPKISDRVWRFEGRGFELHFYMLSQLKCFKMLRLESFTVFYSAPPDFFRSQGAAWHQWRKPVGRKCHWPRNRAVLSPSRTTSGRTCGHLRPVNLFVGWRKCAVILNKQSYKRRTPFIHIHPPSKPFAPASHVQGYPNTKHLRVSKTMDLSWTTSAGKFRCCIRCNKLIGECVCSPEMALKTHYKLNCAATDLSLLSPLPTQLPSNKIWDL